MNIVYEKNLYVKHFLNKHGCFLSMVSPFISGTHWVWEILQELLSSESSSDTGRKLSTMLDFQAIEKMNSLPSPRILNTHFPPQLLPQAIKEKKTRIVYLYRNPKDVAISAYYFFSKVFEVINANVGDLENFKRHLLTGKGK